MIKKIIIYLFSTIIIFLSLSLFIVKEGDVGLILKFGKIKKKYNNILLYYPGINFKLPFIEKVKIIDNRIKNIDNKFLKFNTFKNKEILIDYYVKWIIDDYNLYYLSTNGGNLYVAESIIKKILNNEFSNRISKLNFINIIKDYNKNIIYEIFNYINIYKKDNKYNIKNIGVKILDIGIEKINVSNKEYKFIINRIKLERKLILDKIKINNELKIKKLKLEAENKCKNIILNSKNKALIINNNTNLKITNFLIKEFNKNKNFYFFIKKIKIFNDILNKK